MDENKDVYHEQGTSSSSNPAYNDKYVSPDGHKEVVFNENGQIVTDPVNQGTYNYSDPNTDPVGHFINDMVPYYVYGNSPSDPTTMFERITGTYTGDVNTTKAERTENDRKDAMDIYYEHH